jgi:hypothetical protein
MGFIPRVTADIHERERIVTPPTHSDRREFLACAAAVGAAAGVAAVAFAAEPAQVRVGVIGCGSVSHQYLPHLTKCRHVELVSACDIIPERAKAQAEKFKIPSHYPHIDKMLAGAGFDLLVNLTDMQEHEHLNRQAVEAGKHVWTEKPMANLIAGMLIWSHGRTSLLEKYASRFSTFDKARPVIERWLATRVPGTAVFISPSADHVPPILVHHVERSRSLHETVMLLTVERPPVPVVAEDSRWRLFPLGDGFYRLVVAFGYMEEPLLLPVLHQATQASGIPLASTDTTYYVGHETIVVHDESAINRIPEAIFSFLNRNAVHEERRYGMPLDQIVEIGAQLRI